MTKTYNISRQYPNDIPFDFVFEWFNGAEETGIVCSLHAAIKLAEEFQKFGYKELEGSIQFTSAI
jgi:hypothetical protein